MTRDHLRKPFRTWTPEQQAEWRDWLGTFDVLCRLQLAAKVRVVAGRRGGIGPIDHPVAEPNDEAQERIAYIARTFDARVAAQDPAVLEVADGKDYLPASVYGGVLVMRATTVSPPPTALEVLEPPEPRLPFDVLLAGGGWIARQVGDQQWVVPDPDRATEIELLRILCDDPIAREVLTAVDPWLGGLDRALVTELLDADPGPMPVWVPLHVRLLRKLHLRCTVPEA